MSETIFVKYCPLCGAENPRQQAFCLRCFDGDLTTIAVEPRRSTNKPTNDEVPSKENESAPNPTEVEQICILELIENPQIRFEVHVGQTVGRTEKADIILRDVPKLDWISGAHVKMSKRGDQWYVQHIGSTNFIKIDGERFDGTEEVALYDGSILTLSLTSFRVSFREG